MTQTLSAYWDRSMGYYVIHTDMTLDPLTVEMPVPWLIWRYHLDSTIIKIFDFRTETWQFILDNPVFKRFIVRRILVNLFDRRLQPPPHISFDSKQEAVLFKLKYG